MSSLDDGSPLFCARCQKSLEPGTASLYEIRIEAIADPFPPTETAKSPEDVRAEIQLLLERLDGLSARDAQDQVCRRLVLHLCVRCYRQWIENPTG